MHAPIVTKTQMPELHLAKQGKVRDIYDLGDQLLLVSTDRISAFDCVLPNGIPAKGKVLNLLSAFWFRRLAQLTPHHMITVNVSQFPPIAQQYRNSLEGRATLVRKTTPIEVECVVRGYLAGSAWREYREQGTVGGIAVPGGLSESSMLPQPLFTPSTKAQSGHDEPISFSQMTRMVGKQKAEHMREVSLQIYTAATGYLQERGFILADTKFEFGMDAGRIVLIDECLTPDSSRFWLQSSYTVGTHQDSFDKQFVRDYLAGLSWDKSPPAPSLPTDIVAETSRLYQEAYKRITGVDLP